MKTTKTFWSILTMLIVTSIMLAACGGAATEEPMAEEPMTEVSFDVMPGSELEMAIQGE